MVTGSCGFIGTNLVIHLLEMGHTVIGVDNFSESYNPLIKRRNSAFLKEHGAEIRDLNLINFLNLHSNQIEEYDAIFHLAALPGVGQSWDDFLSYSESNINLTYALLKTLSTKKTPPKLFFASSSSVYGGTKQMRPMNEAELPDPLSPYGVSKLSAESLINAYRSEFGINATNLRFFTVYGPRQRPDMAFNIFIRKAMNSEEIEIFGGEEKSRDFTFVGDVVQILEKLLAHEKLPRVLNIGGGNQINVHTAAKKIISTLGAKSNLSFRPSNPGDPKHTLADNSLLLDLIGPYNFTTFNSGLDSQIGYELNLNT